MPDLPTGPPASTIPPDLFADGVAAAAARHLALVPAASMDELARAAGVSRATLFRRFPSRAALVAELCGAAASAFLQAVDRARPEDGPPAKALERVVQTLGLLAPIYGLLGLQPLDQHVEASLLEQAAETEERLRRLVRRGQEAGDFRVDVDPEWVVAMVTWLLVAAADSVRLGRLTTGATQRHLVQTVTAAVLRPGSAAARGEADPPVARRRRSGRDR